MPSVLIKLVLESLLIYAIGTVILPLKVLKKLAGIMRNFFWGATDERKRMVMWLTKKVTIPKGMGGLGLRSLKEINQALVLKNVWKYNFRKEVRMGGYHDSQNTVQGGLTGSLREGQTAINYGGI